MKVLVISRGVVGRDMGSSGVRSYNIARVLAEQLLEAEITLATPNQPDIPSPHHRLRIVQCAGLLAGLRETSRHDVIISRDFPPYTFPFFFSKRFILDFYAVLPIEWTALSRRILHAGHRKIWADYAHRYVNLQLTLADFVACSNAAQRDTWIGSLAALGLIPPRTYDGDATLRKLIDVAPYGVRSGRPQRTRRVLKGVVPGISETDKVLLWNGSIMEWFDTETVLRAMAKVTRVRDDVKLYFLGTEHPDLVTGMLLEPPRSAVALAKELGLYDRSVFFNVGWVPYEEIGNYLAESDVGACAGYDNEETRVAFRTRYVDLFWAELPVICTRGDSLGERIDNAGAGIVVAPGDVDAYADAILRLLDDQELYGRARCASATIKEELSWEKTLEPLVRFCRSKQSIAQPKRQRVPALARRMLSYLIGYARQRRVAY